MNSFAKIMIVILITTGSFLIFFSIIYPLYRVLFQGFGGAVIIAGSVGVIASYIHSSIATDTSETIRVKNEHLQELKNELIVNSNGNPAELASFYVDASNNNTKRKLLIDDSEKHWKSFYEAFMKFRNEFRNKDTLSKNLETSKEGWINQISEQTWDKLKVELFAKEIIRDFFQGGACPQDFSPKYNPSNGQSLAEPMDSLKKLFASSVYNMQSAPTDEKEVLLANLSKKLDDLLCEDLGAFSNFANTYIQQGSPTLLYSLWNWTIDSIKSQYMNTSDRRIMSYLRSIESYPPKSLTKDMAFVKFIQETVRSFVKVNSQTSSLLDSFAEFYGSYNKLENLGETVRIEMHKIELTHYLPGKCKWIKHKP